MKTIAIQNPHLRWLAGGALSLMISLSCPTSTFAAGKVVVWGGNTLNGTADVPYPPADLTDVVAIAVQTQFALALRIDGTVVGWGYNGHGQSSPPPGLSDVTAIAAGPYHSLALKRDGTVVGWGSNVWHQCIPPAGLSGVVAISAAIDYSLALKGDGTVVGWGDNGHGCAIPPAGLTDVAAISAGPRHALALKRNGTVVGWGLNEGGLATPPAGLSGVVSVNAKSYYHSLALKKDGGIVGWGIDPWGIATPPASLVGAKAVATENATSMALLPDGTVSVWGLNLGGYMSPPAGLHKVTAIDVAGYTCMALIDEPLSNGSFEVGPAGWDVSGNVTVKTSPPYAPTHGGKLVAFNAMNTLGSAGIIQQMDTEPGHTYIVEFDVGNLGYNPVSQTMRAYVGGTMSTHIYTLASLEVTIPGTTGGRTNWVSRSMTFTPLPGQTPMLSFWDYSAISDGVDLVLDNVRVREIQVPFTFENGGFERGLEGWEAGGSVVVHNTAPYLATEGRNLAVFNSGNSTENGYLRRDVATTPGVRYLLQFDVGNLSYNSLHQALYLTVGNYGYKQRLIGDTIDIPGPGGGATAWISASYEFTANSASTDLVFSDMVWSTVSTDLVLDNVRIIPAPPAGQFINGSFEYGFDGWDLDTSLGWASVETGAPYAPTHGSKLVAFSSGNRSNGAIMSQELDTTPGRTYRLVFDVGNLSYVAQAQLLHLMITDATIPSGYMILNTTVGVSSTSTSGATHWLRDQTFTFTARSAKTGFRFRDASSTSHGLDLVLDNVRLIPQ